VGTVEDNGHNATFPATLTDDRGVSVEIPHMPARIVSLAPSDTEILFAVGAGRRVVGDTTACDYPPEAQKLAHIGGWQVSVEAVEALRPDLVTAVGGFGKSTDSAVAALERSHIPVVVVNPRTVQDTYRAIELIGRAAGDRTEAKRLVADIQSRMDRVRRAVQFDRSRPSVFICYGVRPTIYTTGPGTFIDDLITAAGGRNIVTTPAPQGNFISAEAVAKAQPEVMVAGSEVQGEIRQITGWKDVPAVRNQRFFMPSSPDLLVRPGPRMAQGAEELARYLHPDAVLPGSKGAATPRSGAAAGADPQPCSLEDPDAANGGTAQMPLAPSGGGKAASDCSGVASSAR
jgi:iron complex transport system substrate-binding protein